MGNRSTEEKDHEEERTQEQNGCRLCHSYRIGGAKGKIRRHQPPDIR
jgi:hypothetical protein